MWVWVSVSPNEATSKSMAVVDGYKYEHECEYEFDCWFKWQCDGKYECKYRFERELEFGYDLVYESYWN